jgi:hypothetical protein
MLLYAFARLHHTQNLHRHRIVSYALIATWGGTKSRKFASCYSARSVPSAARILIKWNAHCVRFALELAGDQHLLLFPAQKFRSRSLQSVFLI